MDSQRHRETSRRLTYQWRKLDLLILRDRLRELPGQLRLRPITGRLWLDALFILFIATIQLSILPSLLQDVIYIDLLTPWLIYIFVKQTADRAWLLALVASLMIETYTLAPVGIYFCLYSLILTIIVAVREPLSWRHGTPWAVTIGLALAGIAIFETLIKGITLGTLAWPVTTYLAILARTIISWLVGMVLVFHFLDRDVQEEIS